MTTAPNVSFVSIWPTHSVSVQAFFPSGPITNRAGISVASRGRRCPTRDRLAYTAYVSGREIPLVQRTSASRSGRRSCEAGPIRLRGVASSRPQRCALCTSDSGSAGASRATRSNASGSGGGANDGGANDDGANGDGAGERFRPGSYPQRCCCRSQAATGRRRTSAGRPGHQASRGLQRELSSSSFGPTPWEDRSCIQRDRAPKLSARRINRNGMACLGEVH
jgi:hypothetical protein